MRASSSQARVEITVALMEKLIKVMKLPSWRDVDIWSWIVDHPKLNPDVIDFACRQGARLSRWFALANLRVLISEANELDGRNVLRLLQIFERYEPEAFRQLDVSDFQALVNRCGLDAIRAYGHLFRQKHWSVYVPLHPNLQGSDVYLAVQLGATLPTPHRDEYGETTLADRQRCDLLQDMYTRGRPELQVSNYPEGVIHTEEIVN